MSPDVVRRLTSHYGGAKNTCTMGDGNSEEQVPPFPKGFEKSVAVPRKQEHNPNMEIAEKLDKVKYKLWDVLASVDYSPVRGICFEVIDKTEKLAEKIKKHPSMNHQDITEKTKSALSRIPDLKPSLQYCRENNDPKVQEYVNKLVKLRDDILKNVNALPEEEQVPLFPKGFEKSVAVPRKQEHNPNMEIAKKLDKVRYTLWDVLASVDYSPVRGICFEVIDKTEKLAEKIKKHPNMDSHKMVKKTESALSRISDLKPSLEFCREKHDPKVQEYVNKLVKLRDEIRKKVNALPKQ
ncbi:hypothetical protein Ddc_10305 [Ditylenchus destructor]|nr:hypothetical protein Ddc_10305 [Ditylenchus destructor]